MEEIALILPPPPFPQPPNPFNMNHFCLELNLKMFLLTQINSLLECGRAGLFFFWVWMQLPDPSAQRTADTGSQKNPPEMLK